MSDSTALATTTERALTEFTEEEWTELTTKDDSIYLNDESFERAKRHAIALSKSTIVPRQYQGSVANCLVALEYAQRIGVTPLALMQNLDIIEGKPSLRGAFLLGVIRSRFDNVRHEFVSERGKDDWGCRLLADHPETGETLVGTLIDWPMVKGEGWLGKSGSKWKTMPEQMFVYRTATFWARKFIPHVILGMHTDDELVDVRDRRTAPVEELNAALEVGSGKAEPQRIEAEEVGDEPTDYPQGDQPGQEQLPWEG